MGQIPLSEQTQRFLELHPAPWSQREMSLGTMQIVDAAGNDIRDWAGLFSAVIEIVNQIQPPYSGAGRPSDP